MLVDLVVAEVVYVLESVYELERERVAELLRAIIGFPAIVVADEALLLRTLELYEQYRIHFAESYLAACAELSGVGMVASFDREIDRVSTSSGSSPAPEPRALKRVARVRRVGRTRLARTACPPRCPQAAEIRRFAGLFESFTAHRNLALRADGTLEREPRRHRNSPVRGRFLEAAA